MTLGLTKVNQVLGPAPATASSAAENGFPVATSSTPLTLSVGLQAAFEIDDTPARTLFTSRPYVVLTCDSGSDLSDWAAFRVDAYDRETSGLAGEIVAVNGAIGDAHYSDWVIFASAGLTASVIETASDVSNAFAQDLQAAQDAAAAAEVAESVLADGPVSSVNGSTVEVAIGIGDIPDLTAQLATTAAIAHGHTIAQVSRLQLTPDTMQAQIDVVDGGSY